jgi:hypothetical protein
MNPHPLVAVLSTLIFVASLTVLLVYLNKI